MHVDTFIDNFSMGSQTREVRYARWFLFNKRLAAVYQNDWKPWIERDKLFCTYEGKRYRVTGCSRLGDIWLQPNHELDRGYEKRVYVTDVSDWSDQP